MTDLQLKDLLRKFAVEFCDDKGVYGAQRYQLVEHVVEVLSAAACA